ncbi:MAG: hypothetical protein JWP89_4782 [Schlesneria sp.]|nr:hypothetical protein [Schlesneria sp.]
MLTFASLGHEKTSNEILKNGEIGFDRVTSSMAQEGHNRDASQPSLLRGMAKQKNLESEARQAGIAL